MIKKSKKHISTKQTNLTKNLNSKLYYNVNITLTNNNTFVNISYNRFKKIQLSSHLTKNKMIAKKKIQSKTVIYTNGGLCGFTGSQKANPIANYTIGENIAKKTKKLGINRIKLYLKGRGKRKKQLLKGFLKYGFVIKAIRNITPIPFNGCRRKKQRRL